VKDSNIKITNKFNLKKGNDNILEKIKNKNKIKIQKNNKKIQQRKDQDVLCSGDIGGRAVVPLCTLSYSQLLSTVEITGFLRSHIQRFSYVCTLLLRS